MSTTDLAGDIASQITSDLNRLSNDGSNTGNSDFLEKFVTMPKGTGSVIVRILPPADVAKFDHEKPLLYQKTRLHKVNGRYLHCPREFDGKSWKGTCPVCNWYSHLWKESEKESDSDKVKELQSNARSLKPIERYYYNVIIRNVIVNGEAVENVGPKILSIGKTLHGKILRAIVGDPELDEKKLGDIWDMTTGRDFKIMKKITQGSGDQSYPNYSDSKFLEISLLGTAAQVGDWLDGLHDLAALRNVKELEEMKRQLKIHCGVIADTQSDFDPSEYMTSSTPSVAPTVVVEETVQEETKPEAVVEETTSEPVTEPVSEGDQVVDQEFLNTLNNLG